MKTSYQIGKWFYLITLGLYLFTLAGFAVQYLNDANDMFAVFYFSLIFALLSQIVLGIVHIILAIYAYGEYKSFDSSQRNLLNTYSFLVLLFFTVWIIVANTKNVPEVWHFLILLIIVPMLLGAWFVMILYKLSKPQIDTGLNEKI